jgi:2-polyprenyl-6-methoxyphenol hydroxylase-like FAD-dependent oxidoreductase
MNTGLHDVWNLAWKLDLAAHGYASEDLLASYAAERLPAIRRVIGSDASDGYAKQIRAGGAQHGDSSGDATAGVPARLYA